MRYTFVNGTDYRSDNISAGVKYQLQAIHMTKVYHYNDTLDMLFVSKDPMKTTVRVCVCCKIEVSQHKLVVHVACALTC